MWRGAFQLGDHVALGCATFNESGAQESPVECPSMRIYDSGGTAVVSKKIPPSQDRTVRGLFHYAQFLGPEFSEGRHYVVYEWMTSGGYFGQETDCFMILPGGSAVGNVISLFFFDRPEAKFVVGQTDAGVILLKRNPRIQ